MMLTHPWTSWRPLDEQWCYRGWLPHDIAWRLFTLPLQWLFLVSVVVGTHPSMCPYL